MSTAEPLWKGFHRYHRHRQEVEYMWCQHVPAIIHIDTSCYHMAVGRNMLKHVETHYPSEHVKNKQNGLFGDLSDIFGRTSTIIYHPGLVFWAVDV